MCNLKLLLAVALTFNLAAGARAQVQWRSSLDAAQAEARSTDKLMMIDVSATWCPCCRDMEAHTYPDSSVIQATQDFVPVRVDADHEGKDFSAEFNVTLLPTLLIVDSNWHEQTRIIGYVSPSALVETLHHFDPYWTPPSSSGPQPNAWAGVPTGTFSRLPTDAYIPVGDMRGSFADPYESLTAAKGIALANACIRKHDYTRAGKVARALTKAGKGKSLGHLYNMLGDAAQIAGTPAAAWGWYDLTIQHSTDPDCLSHAYLQIGEYDATTDNIDAARTNYQALIDLATASDDVRDKARELLAQLDSGR
ncbi:MAG: thioredoxin family protein [Capsulimonadaceae bacterium]